MLITTFELLKKNNACEKRYKHLAKSLGGITKYGRNEPISILKILTTNGINDALWALRAVPEEQAVGRDKLARLFACDCAERVLHIYEKDYPEDKRPRQAIEIARLFTEGKASEEELAAAWDAARDAAWDAAWDAEREWQKARLIEILAG